MRDNYFIHLFETPLGKYFYDVNKNEIVEVDEDVYEYLSERSTGSEDTAQKVKQLLEKGYLKKKRVKVCKNSSTDYIQDFMDNRISYLVLQVTQMCNLRCEYCVYSGSYETRTHDNKRMDLSTAQKAIDFLISHSFDEDSIELGFYGGEPLLEFALIKDCVKYIKEKAYGKKLHFHITTNATLLNKEVAEFFADNDFTVTVSLDGPREVHNRSRRFPESNEGSFDVVMKNLRYLQERFPVYYKEKVSFNAVLTTKDGLDKIEQFFSNDIHLKENGLTTSLISDAFAKERTEISEQYIVEERCEDFLVLLSKIGRLKKNINLKIAEGIFENLHDLHKHLELHKRDEIPDVWHHGGPCVPGMKRLFVNAEGKFYPCEKVSETLEGNCIGDIESGLDVDSVYEIMNVGKCNHNICKDCWIYSLCGVCVLHINEMDRENTRIQNTFCASQRKEKEMSMINYTILKKLGYDFNSDMI